MFNLEIRTANAAFVDGETGEIAGYELARILRELADQLEPAYLTTRSGSVSRTLNEGSGFDVNGNKVGDWTWTA